MRIRLVFLENQGENSFYGIKPEHSDLYFCAFHDGNNKTSHLLKHLIKGNDTSRWISTEDRLNGAITSEKWLEVEGDVEKWIIQKVKEFEFLTYYHNGYG